MYESENTLMTPEEELVDLLLDFIIVSANLAKKVNRTMKQKQITVSSWTRATRFSAPPILRRKISTVWPGNCVRFGILGLSIFAL